MFLAVTAVLGGVFVLIDKGSSHNVLMTLLTMRVTSVFIVGCFGIGYLVRRRRTGIVGSFARPRWRDAPAIVVIGWTDAGANGLYGAATRHGLVSVTSVLASLYPVVTVLLARFLEGERMRRIQNIGVALAMCGVVLLAAG